MPLTRPPSLLATRPVRVLALGLLGAIAFSLLLAAQAGRAPRIRLTLNENAFGPSPLVAPALREGLQNLHRYTTEEESGALVRLLAEKEGVSPQQIVLGELLEPLGLHLALRDGPGGEFIYSVPGYPALADAAARVGGVAVPVPLDARLENDLPAIAARVTDRTRAVFLVNPHNPSGTVSDAAAFHDFLRTVSRRTLVIVDEAYLEFSDDHAGRTAVAHTRAGENVLVYRTFAKAYGLAALPLGYAVAPRDVADFLRKQGLGHPRDQNRLALTAAVASLRDPGYLDRVRQAVTQERDRWHRVLGELGLRHTQSQGNFVYFDAGRPHAEVAAALQDAGILIGRAFPPHDTWVRITVGRPQENAPAHLALRRFYAEARRP